MKTSSNINNPKENQENKEELLIKKEFKLKYLSEIYEIIIGKSKNNIFIKSSIYELKLNSEDLSILTKYQFNSIDDSFEFIENIFNQKKSYIKNISSDEMKLIIKTFDIIKGKEKEIELCLLINFDNKNEVIKDLINKYTIMEKEIKELKDDKKRMKEENDKLNQNIEYLKMEVNSIKYSQNNEIVSLHNQVNNFTNMINQIYQQLNEINILKQEINTINNKINSLSIPTNSLMLNNQFPTYFNQMDLNNINQMNNNNDMGYNNFLSDKKSENKNLQVIFRPSGDLARNNEPPITIACLPSDKIRDIIHKYRAKANNFNTKVRFIYNAKDLNPTLTVAEAGLCDNCNIFVFYKK
jgi:FtsZ-binding cell division protein ZapB